MGSLGNDGSQSTSRCEVAVLLATYNGSKFVDEQVRSFSENRTTFTLHWLDDHSTDNTRLSVRETARRVGVEFIEWHQPQRQGLPGAFFQLLESVEADVYLFSDQDDIWEPGKIDAAVQDLLPHVGIPSLCFSDPLMFRDDRPQIRRRLFDVLGARAEVALQESRLFMGLAPAHTQAFTRPLRDIFLQHKDVARAHAFMHDLWMYDIAMASGTIRMLSNVPTTLYRLHGRNTSSALASWKGRGIDRVAVTWRQHQRYRRGLSRHARGFIVASSTLPDSPKLKRIVSIARLVATLDRWKSPIELARLVRAGALWGSRRLAFGLAVVCLCSDAGE